VFIFRPVNAKEFPQLKDYPAAFRYTLKIRVASDEPLPRIERLEAFTDSEWKMESARLVCAKTPPVPLQVEAFNGKVEKMETVSETTYQIPLQVTGNSD